MKRKRPSPAFGKTGSRLGATPHPRLRQTFSRKERRKGSKHLRHVAGHEAFAAEAAIVFGRGQAEIAARCLERQGQMAEAHVNAGARIEKPGTGAAIADGMGGLALHLEDAQFAMGAARPGVEARFNARDAEREPGGNAIARCCILDHGSDSPFRLARHGRQPQCGTRHMRAAVKHARRCHAGLAALNLGRGSFGHDPAAIRIGAAGFRRYSLNGNGQSQGCKPCKHSILHVYPLLDTDDAPPNGHKAHFRLHAGAGHRVRTGDKQAKCVLNERILLQGKAGSDLLRPGNARG